MKLLRKSRYYVCYIWNIIPNIIWKKYREKSTKYTKQTCQSRAKIVTNINDYLRNKHDFHLYDTCLTQNIYKTKYIPQFNY